MEVGEKNNEKEKNKTNEDESKVNEEQNKSNEEQNKPNEDQNKPNEGQNKGNEDQSKVNDDESKVNDNQNKPNEEKNKENEDKSKTNDDQNTSNEDKSKIIEDKIKVDEDKSKVNEDKSKSSEDKNKAKGEKSKSNEDKSQEANNKLLNSARSKENEQDKNKSIISQAQTPADQIIEESKDKCLRCLNCFSIPLLLYNNTTHSIKISCNQKHNISIDIKDYLKKGFTNNFYNQICSQCKSKVDVSMEKKYYYCKECNEIFCRTCIKSHNLIFNNNNNNDEENVHHFINLEKFDTTCILHNETFDYYCLDCNENICQYCSHSQHKGHKTLELDDTNLKRKEFTKIKDYLNLEKESLNIASSLMKKLIIRIKKEIKTILEYKDAELKFKENIIKIYEKKIDNYNIIQNVKNLLFNHSPFVIDSKKSYIEQLNYFYEYMNKDSTKIKTKKSSPSSNRNVSLSNDKNRKEIHVNSPQKINKLSDDNKSEEKIKKSREKIKSSDKIKKARNKKIPKKDEINKLKTYHKKRNTMELDDVDLLKAKDNSKDSKESNKIKPEKKKENRLINSFDEVENKKIKINKIEVNDEKEVNNVDESKTSNTFESEKAENDKTPKKIKVKKIVKKVKKKITKKEAETSINSSSISSNNKIIVLGDNLIGNKTENKTTINNVTNNNINTINVEKENEKEKEKEKLQKKENNNNKDIENNIYKKIKLNKKNSNNKDNNNKTKKDDIKSEKNNAIKNETKKKKEKKDKSVDKKEKKENKESKEKKENQENQENKEKKESKESKEKKEKKETREIKEESYSNPNLKIKNLFINELKLPDHDKKVNLNILDSYRHRKIYNKSSSRNISLNHSFADFYPLGALNDSLNKRRIQKIFRDPSFEVKNKNKLNNSYSGNNSFSFASSSILKSFNFMGQQVNKDLKDDFNNESTSNNLNFSEKDKNIVVQDKINSVQMENNSQKNINQPSNNDEQGKTSSDNINSSETKVKKDNEQFLSDGKTLNDFKTKTLRLTVKEYENTVFSVLEVNPSMFAIGFLNGEIDIYDTRDIICLFSILEHNSRINNMFLLKEPNTILSSSFDYTMKKIKLIEEKKTYVIEFIFDGYDNIIYKGIELNNGNILSISFGGEINIWNKLTNKAYTKIQKYVIENEEAYDVIGISNKLIAVSTEESLHFFNINTNKKEYLIESKVMTDLEFKRRNNMILVNNNILGILLKNEIGLIDIAHKQIITKCNIYEGKPETLTLLKDKTLLVSVSNYNIKDYDEDTDEKIEKSKMIETNKVIFLQYELVNNGLMLLIKKEEVSDKINSKDYCRITSVSEFSNGIIIFTTSGMEDNKLCGTISAFDY